jgi:hypothetical protein
LAQDVDRQRAHRLCQRRAIVAARSPGFPIGQFILAGAVYKPLVLLMEATSGIEPEYTVSQVYWGRVA